MPKTEAGTVWVSVALTKGSRTRESRVARPTLT